MKEENEGTPAPEGKRTLWGFLIVGVVMLLAGIFVHSPGMPAFLPKAEVLTALFLIVGAVAALIITS